MAFALVPHHITLTSCGWLKYIAIWMSNVSRSQLYIRQFIFFLSLQRSSMFYFLMLLARTNRKKSIYTTQLVVYSPTGVQKEYIYVCKISHVQEHPRIYIISKYLNAYTVPLQIFVLVCEHKRKVVTALMHISV